MTRKLSKYHTLVDLPQRNGRVYFECPENPNESCIAKIQTIISETYIEIVAEESGQFYSVHLDELYRFEE